MEERRIAGLRAGFEEANGRLIARLRDAAASAAPAPASDAGWTAPQIGWHVAAVTELATAALGWEGRDAVVSPRLYDGEFTVDFSSAHEERDLRWAWVPAGLVLALLWALVYTTVGFTVLDAWFGDLAWWWALVALGVVGVIVLVSSRLERAPADAAPR